MLIKLSFQVGEAKDDLSILKKICGDFLNWDIGLDIANYFENGQCVVEFIGCAPSNIIELKIAERMKEIGAKWSAKEIQD